MLKTISSILKFLLIIAVIVAILEIAIFFHQLKISVQTLTVNTNQTISVIRDSANQARIAAEQFQLAAAKQSEYWNKSEIEGYKTLASLRLTIVRTDRSINDDLVPRLALALDNANELSTAAAGELQKTMDRLQPVLANLARASAGAADAMNDPAIKETITHVDETSARAAITAAETAQIAGHMNDAAGDFAAYVHRITTPVRGTWNVLKQLLGLAAQARQAAGI